MTFTVYKDDQGKEYKVCPGVGNGFYAKCFHCDDETGNDIIGQGCCGTAADAQKCLDLLAMKERFVPVRIQNEPIHT